MQPTSENKVLLKVNELMLKLKHFNTLISVHIYINLIMFILLKNIYLLTNPCLISRILIAVPMLLSLFCFNEVKISFAGLNSRMSVSFSPFTV